MATNTFVNQVLELTNQFRAQNGLAPLKLNAELNAAALNHSRDMARQDYFSHTGKNGSKPWDRAKAVGYEARSMGENIAAGQTTPQQVVQGWINSPGHRANLLNRNYTELGVGYFNLANDTGKVNYKHYWTQLFGSGDTNPASNLPRSQSTTTRTARTASGSSRSRTLAVAQASDTNGGLFLLGSSENERLVGRDRDDRIQAQAGDDWLNGGKGNDTLTGGRGRDRFLFSSDRSFQAEDFGIDAITDFQPGVDKIVLARSTFGDLTQDEIGIIRQDAQVDRSSKRIVYSLETGNLFFNENGRQTGLGTGARFATIDTDHNPLTPAPSLTVNDFQIVA